MPETGKPTLIERFKADTNLYDLLPKYGYKKVSSDEYVSPNSQSGHKVKLTDDKSSIMSLSGSDEGIGKESKTEHGSRTLLIYFYIMNVAVT